MILFIIIFIYQISLHAVDEPEYYELSVPFKIAYVVGVSSFTGKDLSDENNYMLKSIPFLLMEGIESLETHTFSEEQKTAYRKSLIRQEILEQNKKLISIKTEMDKLVFNKTKESGKEKIRTGLEKNYNDVLKKITELKSLNPDTAIKVPDELDIELKKGTGGTLLNPPKFSPLQYQKSNNIDLFFLGTLEEVHGYLYLEISCFDGILEKNVFYFKDVLLPEEVYKLVPEIKKEFIKIILGREWSTVQVIPTPSNAFVYVNDRFAGIGTTYANYLKPGLASIKVSHPDYSEQQWRAELKPYEEKQIEVSLEKIETGTVSISSVPSDAKVYVNSIYAGMTLLEVEKSLHLKRIVLKKEGYDDFIFHIGQSTKDSIVAELQISLVDPEVKQKATRDNFYFAFGLWLISIPFPIFLNGFAEDFAYEAVRFPIGSPLYNYYGGTSNTFNLTYWITLAINGGLFVYMGFTLFDYLNAANRPIG
ncbi:MAG: PEGA domain-containing protein [Spirochaetales bacterium]|nr:PEGA domain-containing protein [Spirochaetales bacterium]